MALTPEQRAILAVQTSGISYALPKDHETLVARIADQIREAEADVGTHVGAENEALMTAYDLIFSPNLYAILTDAQNGIDSPATARLANSYIRRIDALRAAVRTHVGAERDGDSRNGTTSIT